MIAFRAATQDNTSQFSELIVTSMAATPAVAPETPIPRYSPHAATTNPQNQRALWIRMGSAREGHS